MLKKSRIFVKRISKVRQTTSNWIVRILNEATSVIKYLSLTLVCNILILLFVFVVFNIARIGPYCNTKLELLLHTYIFINPRSRVTVQDTKTVSDKTEKGARK